MSYKSLSDINAELVAWISGQLALDQHNTVERFELRLAPVKSRPESIHAWTPASKPELFSEKSQAFVFDLAAEVVRRAENYVDSTGLPDAFRFELVSTNVCNSLARHWFLIAPAHGATRAGGGMVGDGDGANAAALATIGPNGLVNPAALPMVAAGQAVTSGNQTGQILAMMMQHVQDGQRIMLERDQAMVDMVKQFSVVLSQNAASVREENSELRAQVGALLKQRQEDIEVLEQARSEDHKRQIEALVATSSEERKTLATKKFVAMLPAAASIVDRYFRNKADKEGKPIRKQPPTPLAITIGKMFASLTEAQLQTLQSVLSIEQLVVLGQVKNVIEEGGEMSLIAPMLYDLADSLSQEQQASIFTSLSPQQAQLFMQAIMMAKATQQAAEKTAEAVMGTAEGVTASKSSSNTTSSAAPSATTEPSSSP